MSRLSLCLCAVWLMQGCAAGEGSREETGEGSDCFYLNQVRNYRVVDEQHIAVKVTYDRAYLVELWRPVRNLDRTRRIVFQSPSNRVCSVYSEVLVDGGVRVRSIRQIPLAERDALLSMGEEVEYAPVAEAEIEHVTGDDPVQVEEEDKQ